MADRDEIVEAIDALKYARHVIDRIMGDTDSSEEDESPEMKAMFQIGHALDRLERARAWGYGPPDPLAPGWYWVKDAEVDPMVVQVVRIDKPDDADDDGLRVLDIIGGGPEDVSCYSDALWCGAIVPPPDEPDEEM